MSGMHEVLFQAMKTRCHSISWSSIQEWVEDDRVVTARHVCVEDTGKVGITTHPLHFTHSYNL